MYKLKIEDLRIWVAIGCSDEEKALPRCVSFDIEILFQNHLNCFHFDSMSDTVCYATITREIEKFCNQNKFNLIEYLASEVHKLLMTFIQIPVKKISVKVTKLLPPVQNIFGGVSFVYSK